MKVDGDINFTSNNSLELIDGFENLKIIEGDFNIELVKRIRGFTSLETIGRFFDIRNRIEEIPSFNLLNSVGAGFRISNTNITTINGFEQIISIGQEYFLDDWFILSNNPNLNSVVGFEFEKALLRLAVSTGLEIGELLAISESDYNFSEQKLLISKRLSSKELVYINKDGATREVPLDLLAVNAIEKLIELTKDHCAEECLFIDNTGNSEVVNFKFLAINSKTNLTVRNRYYCNNNLLFEPEKAHYVRLVSFEINSKEINMDYIVDQSKEKDSQ